MIGTSGVEISTQRPKRRVLVLNVRDKNQVAVRVPACQTGMSPHLIEAHWSLNLVLKVDCAFAASNFQIGSRSNMTLGEHLSDKCAAFERSKEHTRLACQHGDSLDKVLTDAWKCANMRRLSKKNAAGEKFQ